MNNAVILTTTTNLKEYDVQEVYGYISTRFVIGANLFSDFAASITDWAGGISETYTSELEELEELAINDIKEKALLVDMNMVMGFRVNINPVFGSNYSMFMISAYGTAVKIKEDDSIYENVSIRDRLGNKISNLSMISLENLTINDLENSSLFTLKSSIQSSSKECIAHVSGVLIELIKKNGSNITKQLKKKIIMFKDLYKLSSPEDYISIFIDALDKKVIYLMNLLEIIYYPILLAEFEKAPSNDREILLFDLLTIPPNNIYPNILDDIIKLETYLDNKYNTDVEIKTQGLISKKTGWICKKCGAFVNLNQSKCHVCFKDKYGLPYEALYGRKIAYLKGVKKVLKEELSNEI
ncbi:YbjQ family protein [Clostridium paraputrificum]|uniref:YbjQ family protein n=1 Tax=Clostridium TaxID=1485 RepID=UPI003D338B54